MEEIKDEKQYVKDFRADVDAHNDFINAVPYDALEAMESARVFDLQSKKSSNRLTDSMTDTVYRERAARVVGQVPKGQVKAIGKKDKGKGLFMDLIVQKWIFPNANSQRNCKTKFYMWQKKSHVYNTVCALVDKTTFPSGQQGVDFWIISPRNTIPQNGKVSIQGMDYIHVIANWSSARFEEELDDPSSLYDKKILKELMPQFKGSEKSPDPDRDTAQKPVSSIKQTQVATRFEAGKNGRWVTFLPEYGNKIIRDIKNPHDNKRIPVVQLTNEPEFDSWYGTSDFQRSMPMQGASDGVLNGYFQGMNKSLNPRTFIDTTTMIDHTWSSKAGSLVEFSGPFKVETEQISTAALSNFQATQGVVKGAIQSMAGVTDTRSNEQTTSDPAFGKTPEALKMIGEREATRDKQDRDTFEQACMELVDLMLSIVTTLKNKIPVDLMEDEIEEILKKNPDLGEILTDQDGNPVTDEDGEPTRVLHQVLADSQDSGVATMRTSDSQKQIRLRIDPSKLKGLEYRFELDPNSTAATTKEGQLNALKDYFAFLGTIQNVVQEYQQANGVMIDLEVINKQFGELADLPMLNELFKKSEAPPEQEGSEVKQIANYKDAPDDIKRQMEVREGYEPSQQPETSQASPTQTPMEAMKDMHSMAPEPVQAPPPTAPEFQDSTLAEAAKNFANMHQGA